MFPLSSWARRLCFLRVSLQSFCLYKLGEEGTYWICSVTGTSWSLPVVYFLSLRCFPAGWSILLSLRTVVLQLSNAMTLIQFLLWWWCPSISLLLQNSNCTAMNDHVNLWCVGRISDILLGSRPTDWELLLRTSCFSSLIKFRVLKSPRHEKFSSWSKLLCNTYFLFSNIRTETMKTQRLF